MGNTVQSYRLWCSVAISLYIRTWRAATCYVLPQFYVSVPILTDYMRSCKVTSVRYSKKLLPGFALFADRGFYFLYA